MSLLCRVASKQLCSQLVRSQGCCLMYVRPVKLKASKYKPIVVHPRDHDVHNMKLRRPLSPHLTIYKPTIVMVTSISHRITAAVATGCMFGIAACAFSPVDWATVTHTIDHMHVGVATVLLAKTAMALPTTYHCVNGVRHLIWDTGRFLATKEVFNTAYVMMAVTGAITACVVML